LLRFARNDEERTAFDKIKAGLEEAKAYLGGSGDRRRYGVHGPTKK
jgi:hypothetical protein